MSDLGDTIGDLNVAKISTAFKRGTLDGLQRPDTLAKWCEAAL